MSTSVNNKRIVLVGPASDVVRPLAEETAAYLGEAGIRELKTAACFANDDGLVLYTTDEAMSRDTELMALVAASPATVWARCVDSETGADSEVETSRDYAVRSATRYEVAFAAGEAGWGGGGREVARLAAHSRERRGTDRETMLELGMDTFFVSLTFQDYGDEATDAAIAEIAGDATVGALEFRADLLQDRDVPGKVLRALSQVRSAASGGWRETTVMFTVRSADQAGTFPVGAKEEMHQLLELGARAGVDWLDVEWRSLDDISTIAEMCLTRGATRVLLSHHQVGRRTSLSEAQLILKEAPLVKYEAAEAVKLVTDAKFNSDDVARISALSGGRFLTVALGEKGQVSRLLNRRFTPATHDALPKAAAPGQLTPSRTMELRHELGLLPKSEFFILMESDFGSKSPAMHNAAFAACKLPHHYGVMELPKGTLEDEDSDSSKKLRAAFSSPSFGGASVTIPHKQSVVPFLDELTDAATQIGAVNTVIPFLEEHEQRSKMLLRGDNTDWLGISISLQGALQRRAAPRQQSSKALVIGAGGTARAACYALTAGAAASPEYLERPFELYVHARDSAKAEELATAFGGSVVEDLEGFTDDFDVIVSTIPGDAKFTVPDHLLLSGKPAVLDVAYKPAETALLAQAAKNGCARAQGASVLLLQGVAQFEAWTNRRAPTKSMRTAVFDGTVPDLEQEQQ